MGSNDEYVFLILVVVCLHFLWFVSVIDKMTTPSAPVAIPIVLSIVVILTDYMIYINYFKNTQKNNSIV